MSKDIHAFNRVRAIRKAQQTIPSIELRCYLHDMCSLNRDTSVVHCAGLRIHSVFHVESKVPSRTPPKSVLRDAQLRDSNPTLHVPPRLTSLHQHSLQHTAD
jgi:hypothetical protein